MKDVWESLPTAVIANAWRGCGFKFHTQEDEGFSKELEDASAVAEDLVLDYDIAISELETLSIV